MAHPFIRRSLSTGALLLLTMVSPSGFKGDDVAAATQAKPPKLTLTANPAVGLSPTKVRLTAHLVGGASDDETFYCPTIEWSWGDGSQSEWASDCKPYQAGVEITRFFTVQHVFDEGEYRIRLRLKRRGSEIASAEARVEIR